MDQDEVRFREGFDPKHKDKSTKEILDREEQQEVIDELSREGQRLMKSQRYFLTLFLAVIGFLCFVFGFVVEVPVPFCFSGSSFFLLLLFLRRPTKPVLVAAVSIEIATLVAYFVYREQLISYVSYGFNFVYFVLVWAVWSAQDFVRSFPEEISRLENMKYGPKIA